MIPFPRRPGTYLLREVTAVVAGTVSSYETRHIPTTPNDSNHDAQGDGCIKMSRVFEDTHQQAGSQATHPENASRHPLTDRPAPTYR
jgi:hypothetical protein